MYRNQIFPKQDQVIYDYYLHEDGALHVRTYDRYVVESQNQIRFAYRICAKIHGAASIIVKRAEHMDRFANGHYFTLTPDPKAAINAIRDYCVKRIEDAQASSARAQLILQAASNASKLSEVHD